MSNTTFSLILALPLAFVIGMLVDQRIQHKFLDKIVAEYEDICKRYEKICDSWRETCSKEKGDER